MSAITRIETPYKRRITQIIVVTTEDGRERELTVHDYGYQLRVKDSDGGVHIVVQLSEGRTPGVFLDEHIQDLTGKEL